MVSPENVGQLPNQGSEFCVLMPELSIL